MHDLESRLRGELADCAATAHVAADPPPDLMEAVRRRRWARLSTTAVVAAVVLGLVVSVPALVDDRESANVASGSNTQAAGGLPPSPPVLAGSVLANVDADPCPGACSAARFDVGSPEHAVHVDTGASGRVAVLPDGRFVAPHSTGGGQTSVLIDPGGTAPLPLGKGVTDVDVLPDGRLVVLAVNDAGQSVLRKVDPRSGSFEDRSLPSWLKPNGALTAGPGGAVAILGTKEGCCDPSEILVIGADDMERRRRLSLPEERRNTLSSPPAMSWGANGLIAITATRPEPLAMAYFEGRRAPERDDPHPGWTNVVDAATGHLVASLDGWQGLAWSPDGKGLLAAQRDGPGASKLAVWWGPGLKQRIDIGGTTVPSVPRYWQAP